MKEDIIMEKNLIPITNLIPDVIRNTRLNLTLDGWPAAVAVFAICGTIISVYAINTSQHGESASAPAPLACVA